MHAFIDKSVVNAETYYQTYKREPSPAGTFDISKIVTKEKDDMTLMAVLEYLISLGKGAELMIATHSNPDGLMMRLAKGGSVSAMTSVFDVILNIRDGISDREAIRKLMGKPQAKAWQAWFKKYESGIKLDDGFEENEEWKPFVEQKYAEWFKRQGSTILGLAKPNDELPKLIDAVNKVQALDVARIEFRACRIGTDANSLKTIAKFFNATKVIAPKEARTFYGVISNADFVTPAKFPAKLKTLKPDRMFDGIKIGIKIGTSTFKVLATDKEQLKAFIKGFILSTYGGGASPFVIGGLEPSGALKALFPGKANIYPLEPDYLKALEVFDAKPAAATP